MRAPLPPADRLGLTRLSAAALCCPAPPRTDSISIPSPTAFAIRAGQIGSQAAPRFIANNAIREYAAQLLVNETLSFAGVADYRRARALAAQSAADLESAHRDLIVRVVAAYFGVLSANEKVNVAAARTR